MVVGDSSNGVESNDNKEDEAMDVRTETTESAPQEVILL